MKQTVPKFTFVWLHLQFNCERYDYIPYVQECRSIRDTMNGITQTVRHIMYIYIYVYSYIYIYRSCHRMIRVIYSNIVMIAKSWCFCSKLQNHQASLRYSGDGVFLDSDELQDLDSLFECVRAHTSFVVPLLTPGLLTRPWCVGELATAFLNRVTGPQWKDVEGCDRPFQSGGRFR